MRRTIASHDPSFGPSQSDIVQVPNGTNFPTFGQPPAPGIPTFRQTDQYVNPVLGPPSFALSTWKTQGRREAQARP
jgi:hypothetical protein